MSRWNRIEYSEEYACCFDVLDKPGVYTVYGDNRIIYIGQSSSIKKRFTSYQIRLILEEYPNKIYSYKRSPWGTFEDLFIKVSYSKKFGDWAMRELRLIKKLNPPFNTQHAKKVRF